MRSALLAVLLLAAAACDIDRAGQKGSEVADPPPPVDGDAGVRVPEPPPEDPPPGGSTEPMAMVCRDDYCDVHCPPGASCNIDAIGGAYVDVLCEPGSICNVDCRRAAYCDVECDTGASCLIQCLGAIECDASWCDTELVSCGGEVSACNAPCP